MSYYEHKALKKKLTELVFHADSDSEFKNRLFYDTLNTLKQKGITVPPEIKINIIYDTSNVINVVLPFETDEITADTDPNKYSKPMIHYKPDDEVIITEPLNLELNNIDMIEMKLDEIFKSLDKIEDITPDILHVSEGIQKICRLNGDAAIGWIMFNHLTTQKKTDYKYSIKHSIYTSIICSLIVDELTLSESDRISIIAAALTMNIAIIEQQDKLYYNSDRDLRQVQKVAIKIHPIRSVKLLEQKGVKDPLWLNTVLSHHEVIDGTGYTQKLKGEEILLSARIVSISDIYCAKVTGRSYRSGCNPNIVVSDLFIKGDKFIEGDLAKMFVKILGIYPPGTLVKLANNETAIVTHRNGDTPVIYSIFNSDGSPILEPIKRDCKVDEYLINKPIPYTDIDINIQKKQIWNIYHETVAK